VESVTAQGAARYIAERAFRPSAPGPVGIEAEFFVLDSADTARIPSPAELRSLLRDTALPSHSPITFEPGGQLELSAPPADGVVAAIALLAADIEVVSARLTEAGFTLRGGGVDADRVPRWWGHNFRYDAMAAHFAGCGGTSLAAGQVMMTATAGLQLNLDAGVDEAAMSTRWELAHALGPVLSAAFACSPVLAGRPTGAASARLDAWQHLDPCRTRPVPDAAPLESARAQWAAYALAATVMVVVDGEAGHSPSGVFTLQEWVDDPAQGGRAVTRRDIDYHLTTLFPPVRPRGFLELRYLDEQRVEDWPVAAAVAAVLHDDRVAAAAAMEACRPAAGRWGEAARCALADDVLRPAAQQCLAIARDALARAQAPAELQRAVADFALRYTDRGRCPADDKGVGIPVLQPLSSDAMSARSAS
jgi:glutamate--cysteine ligase